MRLSAAARRVRGSRRAGVLSAASPNVQQYQSHVHDMCSMPCQFDTCRIRIPRVGECVVGVSSVGLHRMRADENWISSIEQVVLQNRKRIRLRSDNRAGKCRWAQIAASVAWPLQLASHAAASAVEAITVLHRLQTTRRKSLFVTDPHPGAYRRQTK